MNYDEKICESILIPKEMDMYGSNAGIKTSAQILAETIENLILCDYEVFVTSDYCCYMIEYNLKRSLGYGDYMHCWVTEDELLDIKYNRDRGEDDDEVEGD